MLLLIIPIRWILAAFTAAFVHECCHYIILKLLGVSVLGITIGANGAVIETDALTPCQELICALAGPMGSFLLLLMSGCFPLLSFCGLIQGIYNLIPVIPFDGGRVLKIVLKTMCPSVSDTVMNWVRIVICGTILLTGLIGVQCGMFSLIVALVLLHQLYPRKRPCKEGLKRVQ